MLLDLVAMFGAGVASFLAPCVVPLVPAYLAMVAGTTGAGTGPGAGTGSGGEAAGRGPAGGGTGGAGGGSGAGSGPEAGAGVMVGAPVTPVSATVVFVAGFAAVFAVLGGMAGLVGSSLGTTQVTVQRVGGAVVVVMGLALLGVVRGPLAQERRWLRPLARARGRSRPFLLGVAFGAAWTPCVGPLLGAALTLAAVSGEVGRGVLLLVAYAAGIGVPFVLVSLGLASSPSAAARLRRAAPRVQRAGGLAMVALGALLVTGAYGHLTSYLARFAPTVGL